MAKPTVLEAPPAHRTATETEYAVIVRHSPFPGRPKTVRARNEEDAWQKFRIVLEGRVVDPGRAKDPGAQKALSSLKQAQQEWLSLNRDCPADAEIIPETDRQARLQNLRVRGQEAAQKAAQANDNRQLAVWERLTEALEKLAKD